LATSRAFPLFRSYQLFARVKLQLLDVSRDRNWHPELIARLINKPENWPCPQTHANGSAACDDKGCFR
jgi:hypothetical protein